MSDARWERIKAIFRTALATAEADRRRLLDRECFGDDELRREVESLLAANAPGPLATGAALDALDARDSGTSTVATAPLVERPGTKIGPYKLLQQIGEGGFGVVFMAEQDVPVRRRVALKVIKLGMDTRQVVARFEQERQALALMDHPHIAKVLDAGATPLTDGGGGRPFFVMEYVIGDPITAFADAHKMNLRDRLGLFSQVCAAVQHAHTKGIIHRDLKPRNVLVSMVDGRPHAKVIDFGIAKATGARLTDKTLFTEHRQLIGTPEYMSPEQAEGSPDIDTRTDVYALGVLLYELLTGATPFDARRLRSAAFAEMQRIIKEEEPPMPSVRVMKQPAVSVDRAISPFERGVGPIADRTSETVGPVSNRSSAASALLAKSIRGELDWIVLKALEKDRARRYESPSQLAADVQRHLSGEPVIAAPPSMVYRVRKFVRKHRAAVTTGSMVAAALVVGGGVATWQWQRAEAVAVQSREQIRVARAALNDIIADAPSKPAQRWDELPPNSEFTELAKQYDLGVYFPMTPHAGKREFVGAGTTDHERNLSLLIALGSEAIKAVQRGRSMNSELVAQREAARNALRRILTSVLEFPDEEIIATTLDDGSGLTFQESIETLEKIATRQIRAEQAARKELETKNARVSAEAQALLDAALAHIDPLENTPLEAPFESAIRLYSAVFGESHPNVQYAEFWAAYACRDQESLDILESRFRRFQKSGSPELAAHMLDFMCVAMAAHGHYQRSRRIAEEFGSVIASNSCMPYLHLASWAVPHHQGELSRWAANSLECHAKAQWHVDELLAVRDSHRSTEVSYLLAVAYIRLGDVDEARAQVDRAETIEPNVSGLGTGPLREIVEALIYVHSGEVDAARAELECARKLLAGFDKISRLERAGVFDLFAEAEALLR